MKNRSFALLVAGCIGTALAGGAMATDLDRHYRPGQPDVLKEQPEPEAAERERQKVIDRFGTAYKRAGSPRIAVFWNRTFSDQLSQWVSYGRVVESKQGQLRSSKPYGQSEADGQMSRSFRVDVNVPQEERRPVNEIPAFAFESGFLRPMTDAGAKIVDRATIMRLIHSRAKNRRNSPQVPDTQVVETDALLGFADYIAEILFSPDAGSTTGAAIRVTVKSIQDGQIVASLVSRERPEDEDGPRKWEAAAGGFRVSREGPEPEEVGRDVAMETMQALTRAWR